MDNPVAAVEWKNVSFSVRHGFWMKSKTILQNITISLPAGSVLGLVGPNGAGKTTTLKIGAGLLFPTSGEVRIQGLGSPDTRARAPVGFLTENQYIYPHLRLGEWLAMLGRCSRLSSKRLAGRIEEVLDMVDLTGRKKQMIRTLSKGQLQRAGLAQALIHEPSILMLDEPMSGLDPYWRYRMQQILLDLKAAGKTIVFSSHILTDVERLCDRIILIQNGNSLWEGWLGELPRKRKGFEAICRTDNPESLRALLQENDNRMVLQPKGSWCVTLSEEHKDALFKIAASGELKIESLKPIHEEVEEVLFEFYSQN